jgi:hypothetical protein
MLLSIVAAIQLRWIHGAEVQVVSATTLKIREHSQPNWQNSRIVGLQESSQSNIRARALRAANEWLTEKRDNAVDYLCFGPDADGTLVLWPNYTVFVGNGDREQVDFALGEELVLAGLVKLNPHEINSLAPYPKVMLKRSEASARYRRIGMWAHK